MQKFGLVTAVVLLCTVTLVPAFSEDDYQEREGGFDFGYSNQTISTGYSNQTMFFDDSNATGIGDEISDHVHKRNDLEKQQREEIQDAMKQCRQQAKDSGNRTALQQCVQDLKSLREQYKSFVSQQNTQFSGFRQGLLSQNHTTITPEQNRHALDNIFSQTWHHNASVAGVIKNGHAKNRDH